VIGIGRAQSLEHLRELAGSAFRARIIHGHGKIAGHCQLQPLQHQIEGFEIVGQVDRAEIMPQGGTGRRRRRQHGGNPGQNPDIQLAPGCRIRRGTVILQRLENRSSHGKDPGITG
jgi:hypothetical protein